MEYQNPDYPSKAQVPFKISPEDQRVIQECNKEAFFKRCLPFAISFGGTTYLAVNTGYLKPHPSWGPVPKVMAAAFLGYFLGKVSYQQVCAEKLMAIPDSQLGSMLRARRQKGVGSVFQDSLTLEMPSYTIPEESSRDIYRDEIGPRTFTDLDTDRPYNEGLNDSFRLSVDSPQRPEDFVLPPQASTPNSYEEMRRKNREDFERKSKAFRSQTGSEEPPRNIYQPPQASSWSDQTPSDRYKPTNMYGDIFEK